MFIQYVHPFVYVFYVAFAFVFNVYNIFAVLICKSAHLMC